MALKNGTGTVNGYDIGPNADLSGVTDLAHENLSGANLSGADFFGAFMLSSNLSDANLSDANLMCSDFTNAKFTGADLTDAELTGANFTDATVDPHHVELIESAHRLMMQSLRVNGVRKGGRAKNPDDFEIDTPPPPEEAEANDRLNKSRALYHAAAEVDILAMNMRLYIKHSRNGLAQDAGLVERVAKLEQAAETAKEAAQQEFHAAADAVKKLKAKKTASGGEGRSSLIRRGRSENPSRLKGGKPLPTRPPRPTRRTPPAPVIIPTERDVRGVLEISANDGHTIFKPSAFLEAGVNPALVERYTRKYESDTSHPKSTIYGDYGWPIEEAVGVYGLSILSGLVSNLGLTCESYMGRGFQAQAYTKALKEWLANNGGSND
jgi:hypothetical protein